MEAVKLEARDLEVFNDMPFGAWAKDAEGTILWANRHIEHLAGHPLVGGPDTDQAERVAEYDAHERQVLETGQPMYLHEVARYSGHDYDFSVVKFPAELDGTRCTIGIGFRVDSDQRAPIER